MPASTRASGPTSRTCTQLPRGRQVEPGDDERDRRRRPSRPGVRARAAPAPRPATGRRRDQAEPDQAAGGVDDDVGGVRAPDGQDVLGRPRGPGSRRRRHRPSAHHGLRGRQQAEVEAERDEEQQVHDDLRGRWRRPRRWPANGTSFDHPLPADPRDLELPEHRPPEQGEVDHEQRDQVALAATAGGSPTHRSPLHPRVVRGVGVLGRAAVVDGVGAQLVVPRLVPEDLAQPVPGAVLRQPGVASEPEVDRVARDVRRRGRRGDPAGGFPREPYVATASSRSCSWYAAERQPLLTRNSVPASVAACGAPSRRGSRRATAGRCRRRRWRRRGPGRRRRPARRPVAARACAGDVARALGRGARRGRRGDGRCSIGADRGRRRYRGSTDIRERDEGDQDGQDGQDERGQVRRRSNGRVRAVRRDMPRVKPARVLPARMRFSIRRRYGALSSIGSCACWSSRTSPTWRRPSATACAWRRSRPTSPATATPRWSC